MGEPDIEKIKERLAGLLQEVDRLEKEADAFPAVDRQCRAHPRRPEHDPRQPGRIGV
jgi:hypothetical protein